MKTKDHPKVNHGKQGVLLVNLGTPDSLSLWDIRRYLKEFLSDQRVIELPKIVWQPILRGIILNTRIFKTRTTAILFNQWLVFQVQADSIFACASKLLLLYSQADEYVHQHAVPPGQYL